MRRWYLIIVGLVLLASAFTLWFFFREGEVKGILEASGQVRGTEVTVSSKLPGRVESLKVKEGQAINAGDLIVRISSEEIEARIEQARAQVDASSHRIHQARESLKRGEADVKEAKSQRDLAGSDYDRYSDLIKKGLVSRSEFDVAEARLKSSGARLEAAKKGREEARAAYETTKNQVDEAAARVKEVEAILKDTEIYAPSNGTVINKLVEEGEMVAVGAPVATLIDLSDIYVKVYIPEKDIGKIRLGNPARMYADAFPGRSFEGDVTEISQKAEFTPKEVHMKEERTKLVFGVKVRIKNPEGYLKPGMPVDVKIKWMENASW